jgi:glycosyltransferase involved in cell wall biosynthesis
MPGAIRILFVSYYFPPYNVIGAVRTGKTARHLLELGHDVRVIAAGRLPLSTSLPLEVPASRVTYTRWWNVHRPVGALLAALRRDSGGALPTGPSAGDRANRLAGLYRALVFLPDRQVGWLPFGIRAGSALIRRWKPDLIYTSTGPFTSAVIGSYLARRFRLPWVAEFRDLWAGNQYDEFPAWRARLNYPIERWVVGPALAFVTVSEPLAATLRARYRRPVAVITNGFDPDDFPSLPSPTTRSDELRITFTGSYYEGRQDVALLFAALKRLGERSARVRVEFFGAGLGPVQELADTLRLTDLVRTSPPIAYREALRRQAESDVLLHLLWTDPDQPGVYSGKLFEYIGSRRPILAIGPSAGAGQDLIRARDAGVVLDQSDQVADQLSRWLAAKEQTGRIPPTPESATRGLSRLEQVRLLEQYLHGLLDAGESRDRHPRAAPKPSGFGQVP